MGWNNEEGLPPFQWEESSTLSEGKEKVTIRKESMEEEKSTGHHQKEWEESRG